MAARIIENVRQYGVRIWVENDGVVCSIDCQDDGRFIIGYHRGYHLPPYRTEACISPDKAERIARKFEPDFRRWRTRGENYH